MRDTADPVRILLIEDDDNDTELLVRELDKSQLRYDLTRATDGSSAAEALSAGTADIICADFRIPGMTGDEALALRNEHCPEIPFIIVTGTLGDEQAVGLMKDGATDYVLKGNLIKLPSVILNALETSRQREEAQRNLHLAAQADHILREIAENAPDMIYRYRLFPDRGFEYVSPAAEDLTGYSRRWFYEVDPFLDYLLVHPDDRARLEGYDANIFDEGSLLIRWIRKDGATIWTEQRSIPIRDADGRVVALEGIVRDVTRRQMETEDLKERERTFRSLADNSPDTILRIGRDLRYTYANPATKTKVGKDPLEIVGSTPLEAFGAEPNTENIEYFEDALKRIFSTGQPSVFDLTFYWQEELCFEIRLIPEFDRADEVETVLVLTRDITERRRNEQLLRESYNRLRNLDSQRRRLLNGWMKAQEEERHRIALEIHDDPLQAMTAVGIKLESLKSMADDDLAEEIAAVQKASDSAVARLRNVMLGLRPPGFDREKLSRAIEALTEKYGPTSGTEWIIRDELTSEPTGDVKAMIYRVVEEAIANVHSHAIAHHAVISLKRQEGGYLIRVEDDGVGFPTEDITEARNDHLGLVGMSERAEIAGGWLHIDSIPGKGTVVEFWIPSTRELREAG